MPDTRWGNSIFTPASYSSRVSRASLGGVAYPVPKTNRSDNKYTAFLEANYKINYHIPVRYLQN